MARARNIKPGFWTNEHIVELDPWARLLYIGLWAVADREGRLEDRPKRIKMEVFPADQVDVDALLDSIEMEGLIRRYSVNGEKFIWIPGFKEHQNPHRNEKSSEIPPHPEDEITPLLESSGNGASNPAERGKMNPDSLNEDCGLLNEDCAADAATPDKPAPKPKQKAKRASQISETWLPGDSTRRWAASEGFTDADVDSQILRFVDHWRGKGDTRKDWDATFKNWMRNAKEWGHLQKPPPSATEPKSYSADPDEAERQMRRDLEELKNQASQSGNGVITMLRREA